MTGRILFLDIDGTVRHGPDELGRQIQGPADVVVYPEVVPLLRAYKRAGWRIAGASNQGGIAFGFVDVEQVRAAMRETQRACEGLFDAIAFCSHHPKAPNPARAACSCRKPDIGMVLKITGKFGQRFGESYIAGRCLFVGDRPEDRGCAKNAGLVFCEATAWRTTDPAKVLAGLEPHGLASPLRQT